MCQELILWKLENVRKQFTDAYNNGLVIVKEKNFVKLENKYKVCIDAKLNNQFLDIVMDYYLYMSSLCAGCHNQNKDSIKIRNEVRQCYESVKDIKKKNETGVMLVDVASTTKSFLRAVENKGYEVKDSDKASNFNISEIDTFKNLSSVEKKILKFLCEQNSYTIINKNVSTSSKRLDEIVNKVIYNYDFLSSYE